MREIRINIKEQGEVKKQDSLFGVFLEDLSHALDGGLYGELVQNRSFEYDAETHDGYHALTAWETIERGDSFVQVHTETVFPYHPNNPHYLVVEALNTDKGGGIRNLGYNTGIPIEKGVEYLFSCVCRVQKGSCPILTVRLEDESGRVEYATKSIKLNAGGWGKYECRLTACGADSCGRLALLLTGPATIHLDRVSLFPCDTFRGRENGLRKDLAEMIADLKPAFIRFPGGCLTHVGTLNNKEKSSLYRWKDTLGPIDERPEKRNVLWQYQQTFGMGFYEMFLFCEDLQAEPIPMVSAGHDPHFLRTAEPGEIQEWIDESLDLIEFANGSIDSKWGRIRAQMGHPESFHLKYLTIGNEEVGEGYARNYNMIAKAVRDRYPEIKLINSVIVSAYQGEPEDGVSHALRTGADYTDVHCYGAPEWFLANAHKFINKPGEPKVFLGEYSSCDDTWYNALTEAAFMTGVENTDGIAFMCYAPLLNNVGYSNWKPDLIHFNNCRCYGTSSYYVLKLFMNCQGQELISTSDNLSHGEGISPQRLSGDLYMKVNLADVEIRNFMIERGNGREQEILQDFRLSMQDNEKTCAKNLDGDFKAMFTFIRKEAPGTPAHRGKYAIAVSLGTEENKNMVTWTIDGWQRLTSISGKVGNHKIHHLCRIHSGVEYEVVLQVKDNIASIYIDGVLSNTFESFSVSPEELYYSAVKDSAGDIIIKMVNILPEEKEVKLSLGHEEDCGGIIYVMTGYGPEARNSMEEPMKIMPTARQIQIKKGAMQCHIPGYSIMVVKVESGKGRMNLDLSE